MLDHVKTRWPRQPYRGLGKIAFSSLLWLLMDILYLYVPILRYRYLRAIDSPEGGVDKDSQAESWNTSDNDDLDP